MRDKQYVNTLIKYKWQMGIYEIKDMVQLVKDGIINEQDFFSITRCSYDGVQKKKINSEST